MSNPTPGDLHVNAPLTNISVAFMQSASQFIAGTVFPNVPVQFKSNSYYRFKRDAWNRADAKVRAPGTETAGGGWDVETATYSCDVVGFHKDIADPDRANADSVFNLDREATDFVTFQMLLKREIDWVSSFFGTGIWGADVTGVSASPTGAQFLQWNDANSNPISDVKAQIIALTKKTGFRPNTLVLGPEVENALSEHPDIIERIKYSERGIVTRELMAALFGIDRILVPYPIQNTAAEGASESNSFLYGKSALLAYAAPNAGIMTPSAGYTFSWNGYLGASGFGTRIKRFRMESLASDRIEGESAYDMKVVAAEMGTFFASAVA